MKQGGLPKPRGQDLMEKRRLRVYHGPDNEVACGVLGSAGPHNVTVSLGEIFPLLADAVRSERTWLKDFEDDEITISSDLHDVILAYQHYRRPSA